MLLAKTVLFSAATLATAAAATPTNYVDLASVLSEALGSSRAQVSGDTVSSGGGLRAGDQLFSSNKAAHLNVQGDGNMVVYEASGRVRWSSNTHGDSSTRLQVQGDGNLVLYSGGGGVLWASNTNHGAKLVMQGDCNLVLYNGDNSVGWATNTSPCLAGPSPGPGPAPPSPSPPSPAPPSPSSLPDIPHKSLWFGWWGSNPDVYDTSSIAWDSVSDNDINKYGGPSLRFLYGVSKFFCQEAHESGKCTIRGDYQDRWNEAVPQMSNLLADQKILGFFAGDEMICGNGGTGATNTIVNTVRNTFPRGKAIIWINECGSTFRKHSIPANVDWVSSDHYRKTKKENYVQYVQNMYQPIFHKLQSHQSVVLIPGAGHPKDNHKMCDDKCTAETELKDAKGFVNWAHSDSRIAGIMPYSWSRDGKVEQGASQIGNNGDLVNFYKNLGRSTK